MLDSKSTKPRIGFSTGALERGNYREALEWLCKANIRNVELSALRLDELKPLVEDLGSLPISDFRYVSFHAPSSFPATEELRVVNLLEKVSKLGWNIVVHPDVIREPALWRRFGSRLLIENMDRRKAVGRTAEELERVFANLPEARLCLDVAHARQLDTTLTLLTQIVQRFSTRIAEIHISELDSHCQHQPMSSAAVSDYRNLAWHFDASLPVIIESMLDGKRAALRNTEYDLTRNAMEPNDGNGNGHQPNCFVTQDEDRHARAAHQLHLP